MRYIYFLLVAFFLYFAALQYNDPDPFIWILIYGAMAVDCALAAYGRFNRTLIVTQALCYLLYIVLLWPGFREWLASPEPSLIFDDFAKMQHLYIEEARELLGLVICQMVLLLLWLRSPSKKSGTEIHPMKN